jgi:hypothetical protein
LHTVASLLNKINHYTHRESISIVMIQLLDFHSVIINKLLSRLLESSLSKMSKVVDRFLDKNLYDYDFLNL